MTSRTSHRAAALVLTLGLALFGAALTPATLANADPRYTTTCTQQHLDAGYTAAEARVECKGDETPRGVIRPKKAPKADTTYESPVGNQTRNWWDHFPEFMFPLLIFGALIVAVTIGAYAWFKPKEVRERRQRAAAFAAGGGYDSAAEPAVDYPTDHPEDYAPPPEPAYHVPEQQQQSATPPAYEEQPQPAPQPEQRPQTPPPPSSSGSSSAFDDLI